MQNKKYAVVDFGTNSARLMIATIKSTKVIAESKTLDTIRLDDGMNKGIITKDAMKRASNATLEFLKIAKDKKADEFYCFATSAVRESNNSNEFIEHIKDTCGVDVDIISGDMEASIGFSGATQNQCDKIGLLDIGGGSTEVVLGENKKISFAKSYLTGTVRILQKYQNASPQNLNEYDKCQNEVKDIFLKIPKNISAKKWLGIGGTATALAAVDLKLKVYDPKKVDNHYMSKKTIFDMLKSMKNMTCEARKNLTGLSEKRADVIVFGALILNEFLNIVKADGIYASESDNLEGYLLMKLGL